MDHPPLPDEQLTELRAELQRRGLPRAYIERFVSELGDHLLDLSEERNLPMSAARKLQIESDSPNERLGNPTQLAIFAADQYHSRTFWGRHPVLTFLFGPLPLLIGCWMVCGLALWAILWVIAIAGHYAFGITDESFRPEDHLYLQAITLALVTWYVMVAPPFTAAGLLCRTYHRNALHWRWPVLGCVLLAVVAAIFQAHGRLATGPSPAERGTFMLGFNVGGSANWVFIYFLPRFTVALGIGLLLIKRAQQKLATGNHVLGIHPSDA